MYEDDTKVWDDVLRLAVQDLSEVQFTGVELYGGERLYPICLGNKGDWSYLVLWQNLSCFGRKLYNLDFVAACGSYLDFFKHSCLAVAYISI